jgi:peptidyl-prolyl cis-trans isomerase SurA
MMSGIAAVINDEPITTYDVEKEQAGMEKESGKKSVLDEKAKAQLREAALTSMINRKLISQKIKELDIKVTDEEVKQAIEDVKKQNNITQDALLAALKNQGVSFESIRSS